MPLKHTKAFYFIEEALVPSSTYFTVCDKCSKNLLCLLYLFLVIKGDSSFSPLPRRGLIPLLTCLRNSHWYQADHEHSAARETASLRKHFPRVWNHGNQNWWESPSTLRELPGFLWEKSLEIPSFTILWDAFLLLLEKMIKLCSVSNALPFFICFGWIYTCKIWMFIPSII